MGIPEGAGQILAIEDGYGDDPQLRRHAKTIVDAYLCANTIEPDTLQTLQRQVYDALAALGRDTADSTESTA